METGEHIIYQVQDGLYVRTAYIDGKGKLIDMSFTTDPALAVRPFGQYIDRDFSSFPWITPVKFTVSITTIE